MGVLGVGFGVGVKGIAIGYLEFVWVLLGWGFLGGVDIKFWFDLGRSWSRFFFCSFCFVEIGVGLFFGWRRC